jgi:membrane protein DedA with SNARE-associated domain
MIDCIIGFVIYTIGFFATAYYVEQDLDNDTKDKYMTASMWPFVLAMLIVLSPYLAYRWYKNQEANL